MGQSEQDEVVGRIAALRDLAALGELDDGEDLKPINRDPDLWELRWDVDGTLLRQYHAEPPASSKLLVMLHLHVKHVATEGDQLTTDLQNEHISQAILRYRGGEASEWIG